MTLIAGVDEVGRGPLAGPVVAAAVILDPTKPIANLRDSKKIAEKKRAALAEEIKEKALAYAVIRVEPKEIDKLNILQASLVAMARAVAALKTAPEKVLVDGNKIPEDIPYPCEAIIGGDDLIPEISAASIIAKVARDDEMVEMDGLYPEYGFTKHKGYPTKTHREALIEFGPTPIHRLSYGPVKKLLTVKEES